VYLGLQLKMLMIASEKTSTIAKVRTWIVVVLTRTVLGSTCPLGCPNKVVNTHSRVS
jgi:hypothetical protein